MPPGVCLATAATECFVPGTMVTVGSFPEHHPDYDGAVVVIGGGSSPGAAVASAVPALFRPRLGWP